MLEPLGYSQVLKYLLEISREFEITLISFEKKVDLSKSDLKKSIDDLCKTHNIKWIWLKYDNWPRLGSHLLNILKLFFVVFFLLSKKQISLIHIRSYFPGIILPVLQKIFNFRFIFDMRGLWADEKHDRLGWSKKSYKYKLFKKLENFLLAQSVKIIITWIVVMNLIFSFDSILSAMALSDVFWVMALAIIISGVLMIWLADRVSEFLQKNRMYEVLGLFILFVVGIMFLSEGGHLAHLHLFGHQITSMSKATFYFVIGVLVLTDIVQTKYQKKLMKSNIE